MQVQYSLLDRRPENGLAALCGRHGVASALLRHGRRRLPRRSLARRSRSRRPPLENRSLTKYKLIIDDFGGWDLFQELLGALRRIADRHGVDIAAVASRAMLDRPAVAAVIVGARNRAHLAAQRRARRDCALTPADHARSTAVLAQRRGPGRRRLSRSSATAAGRHGSIMKYNLNAELPEAWLNGRAPLGEP